MAILVDHRTKTSTSGSVATLTALLEARAIRTVGKGVTNKKRAAQSLVRAAIRRGGTVNGAEIVLSPDEYTAWEIANPTPEWWAQTYPGVPYPNVAPNT